MGVPVGNFPSGSAGVQHHNAVFNRIGEIVNRQAQLSKAAQHSAGFHTAQLAPYGFLFRRAAGFCAKRRALSRLL